jgi:curved DNA-binding protein CbpA
VPGSELSYYDLLGLRPDASPDEIRSAYDALMVRIRPNVAHDTASTIRLAAAVKEAWETLGDPGKRHAYDETLRGTAAYADIWRRSQQASYIENRNQWFDAQVRRAQSERQATFEHQAERDQFDKDYATVAASNATVDLAREGALRAAEARQAEARGRLLRFLTVIAGVVILVVAGVWARGLIARKTTALPATQTTAAAQPIVNTASAGSTASRPRARNAARTFKPISSGNPKTTPIHAAAAAQSNASNSSLVTPVLPTSTAASARPRITAPGRRTSQRSIAVRPAYACKTVAIATVTHDGSVVDLSDGRRYQLTDPVDKAQAGGWTTGTAVAECAWPASLKRPASLDVNGYSARALPAVIAAVPVATPSTAATAGSTCADASITQVTEDGFGVALSDGHVYAVADADHVTTAGWLVGDAVSVCSVPARGANAFTVTRFGVLVNAARTQSLSTAATAPTLCVVRLVSALAGDGSRIVFNDGHTYRVDGSTSRAIVASWALGERVTVCIKLANGTVNATLARAGLTAHAVRAD